MDTTLNHVPLLHLTLSYLIQNILNESAMYYLEAINSELQNSTLISFEADKNLLSIALEYDSNTKSILEKIESDKWQSNKFELLVMSEERDDKKYLFFDLLHHDLNFLVDIEMSNKSFDESNILLKEYFDTLELSISERKKRYFYQDNLDRLIVWAKECSIDESLFPYNKTTLKYMRSLNLSGMKLGTIPSEICALTHLQELYLGNTQLTSLPKELFLLKKLKILDLQNNFLNCIPKDIKNLQNLEKLFLHGNNLEYLPYLQSISNLKYLTLHANRLQEIQIKSVSNWLPANLEWTKHDQKILLPFFIEPLSLQTLDETVALVEKVFHKIDYKERMNFVASLQPEKHKHIYIENEMANMQYWIAKDKLTQKIIGVTGIYNEIDDEPDDCWLGWFCIDEEYRGNGFGKKLLQFSEEMALSLKKKNILIYTYDSKLHHNAISMYKKQGYHSFEVKDTKYKKDLYFKKILK